MIVEPDFYFPQTSNPDDWIDSTQRYVASANVVGPDLVQSRIHDVLEYIQEAMNSGRIRFKNGEVKEGMDFANKVLTFLRRHDGSLTSWNCTQLVPPSVALFVQPVEDGRFNFQPMFTL